MGGTLRARRRVPHRRARGAPRRRRGAEGGRRRGPRRGHRRRGAPRRPAHGCPTGGGDAACSPPATASTSWSASRVPARPPTLAAVRAGFEAAGYEVIGTATSGQAARNLGEGAGMASRDDRLARLAPRARLPGALRPPRRRPRRGRDDARRRPRAPPHRRRALRGEAGRRRRRPPARRRRAGRGAAGPRRAPPRPRLHPRRQPPPGRPGRARRARRAARRERQEGRLLVRPQRPGPRRARPPARRAGDGAGLGEGCRRRPRHPPPRLPARERRGAQRRRTRAVGTGREAHRPGARRARLAAPTAPATG